MRKLEGLRILIVEDDETNLFLLSQLLKKQGCIVTSVKNGEDGLTELKKGETDIALIDINLGYNSMTGIEMLRAYQELELGHSTKTVALTAYAMDNDKEKLLNEGFDVYYSKPFIFEELLEMIWGLFTQNNKGKVG